MLQLFQFYPAFGVRNLSPFCLKLETYLRMSGIEHEVVWSSSTRGAPKGKLPYIVDADVTVGDSELIIDYLIEKFGDRLDGKLSASQQALSVAWRRLFEDSLMFPFVLTLLGFAIIGAGLWWQRHEEQLTRRLRALLPQWTPMTLQEGLRKWLLAEEK